MLGEALALRVIEKSNPTLTFLYQKIGFGMFSIVDFSVMPKFNLTIIMFVLRGTQIWQKKIKRYVANYKKTNATDFVWNWNAGNIYQMKISRKRTGCW